MSTEIELCSECLRIEKHTGLTRDAEIRINPDDGTVEKHCECWKGPKINIDKFLKEFDAKLEKEFKNGRF